jgi:hypothetical protein
VEHDITEKLIEILKKKQADFITLAQLVNGLPKALRRQLGVAPGMTVKRGEEALKPHLGDALVIKRGGRGGNTAYLAFKQPDETLLFRLVQKYAGNMPRLDRIPFRKEELLSTLNRLIEQGRVWVKVITDSKGYKPFLIPVEGDVQPQNDVSEEKFKEAYFELERGNFYVRICDLRRRLSWTTREFDAMLTQLRDGEKIQLQAGDIDFFSEEDIRESFIDENGFRRLTLMWR